MDNQELLQLPESKQTVVVARYLTTGQSRELQRMMLSRSSYNQAEGKLENLPADSFLDVQDKAAELLIKEIRNPNGEPQQFTKKWLDDLSVGDGNLVYEKINELTQNANLSTESKKK